MPYYTPGLHLYSRAAGPTLLIDWLVVVTPVLRGAVVDNQGNETEQNLLDSTWRPALGIFPHLLPAGGGAGMACRSSAAARFLGGIAAEATQLTVSTASSLGPQFR